jgi:hypothetical protein
MTLNKIKLYVSAIFILPVIGVMIFSTKPLGTVVKADPSEAATTYKAKCAMCHSPTAEKSFDTAKTDEVLVEIILKGKKGEKPPFMPGFEAKGMTPEQAKALVDHMRSLRKPAG